MSHRLLYNNEFRNGGRIVENTISRESSARSSHETPHEGTADGNALHLSIQGAHARVLLFGYGQRRPYRFSGLSPARIIKRWQSFGVRGVTDVLSYPV